MRGFERTRRGWRAAGLAALAAAVGVAVAGCLPYQLAQILNGPQGKALAIAPSTTVVAVGGTATFSGSGGVPPYSFALASGAGSVNASTGAYSAPFLPGSAVVRITDKTGHTSDANVSIQSFGGALAISPSTISVTVGGTVTFVPVGGFSPYAFSIQANGSGNAVVGATSGVYVAGTTPGTDVVKLADSTGAWVTSTVTVTAVSSGVDYSVPATSLALSGTVSSALPGGETFTLHNGGNVAGSATVSWQLFLSADKVLGGGDMLVGSGTTSALAAGASATVAVSGTIPAVSPGVWYLIVLVSAADDTTPANNTSAPSPVTLSAQNIDYAPTAASSTGATQAGGAMSGTFSIKNVGTATGTATVNWAVYASLDTTLDASDYVLARGTQAALAGGATVTIPFAGYWPSTPGAWYLIAVVSADDDVNPSDNTVVSASTVTTTGPAPANVDYSVVSVSSTGGSVAGDPLSATFTIHNTGSNAGAQTVYWTAYLSTSTTLVPSSDPVVNSGSTAALATGATSSPISITGTWPAATGTWYILVALSASDDVNPGNNVGASTAITTVAPNVDYTVGSVASTGGTTAGSPLNGTLSIQNVGTHAGTQIVLWSVYLSTSTTLGGGTNQLVATGEIPSPGLAAGTSSGAISFSGMWPASNTAQTWYLVAVVQAGDDVNASNNTGGSTAVTVTPPNVDYTVTSVVNTGGTTAAGPMTGTFTYQNVGSSAGAASVTWTAYLSTSNTLNTPYSVIASGAVGPLAAGASSAAVPFSGTWPGGTATWYLIIIVSATDDVTTANNSLASSAVTVIQLYPTYSITSVPTPSGSVAAQPVNGTFTIQNIGTGPGSSAITWQVYASLGDAVYNSGDVLLASGSTGALPSGGSTTVSYGGTWPTATGTYYIVVRAAAVDAPAMPDAASGAVLVTGWPPPDYTAAFDPGIPWSGVVNTAMNLTGTCQFTITNVSANAGQSPITWSVYLSLDRALDSSDTLIQQGTTAALGAGGTVTVPFNGTWPIAHQFYWLIVVVQAADDNNPVNNVVAAPHPLAIADFRYVEGTENNSAVGPAPIPSQTSATGVSSLGAYQAMVIEGTMDTYGNYDTYKFSIASSGVSTLSVRAAWATGFDDIDLYLWDTSTLNLHSADTTPDSEPGSGTWVSSGITSRTLYVSAYFYLAGGTSGSAGQKYIILTQALP